MLYRIHNESMKTLRLGRKSGHICGGGILARHIFCDRSLTLLG